MMMADEQFPPPPSPTRALPNPLSSAIKAVVIRPNGDVNQKHLSRFTDKFILPTDPIFHSLPTEISTLIELPLLVVRLVPRQDMPADPYHKNRPATFLHMRACSGFAGIDWQQRVGSVLVARADRKPLSCLHLEGIWRYHWMMLRDVNAITGGMGVSVTKFTRKGFEAFWAGWKQKQIEAGRDDFEDLGSPYEV
jgi:hypothetical protein